MIRQWSKQRDAAHTNDILAQGLYSQLLLGSETHVKSSDVSLMLSMCLTQSRMRQNYETALPKEFKYGSNWPHHKSYAYCDTVGVHVGS